MIRGNCWKVKKDKNKRIKNQVAKAVSGMSQNPSIGTAKEFGEVIGMRARQDDDRSNS